MPDVLGPIGLEQFAIDVRHVLAGCGKAIFWPEAVIDRDDLDAAHTHDRNGLDRTTGTAAARNEPAAVELDEDTIVLIDFSPIPAPTVYVCN